MGSSNDHRQKTRTSTSAARLTPHPPCQGYSVGNSPNAGQHLPAFQVPIPWEDFEASHHSPVCRAASGSIQHGISFQGAGDKTPFDRKEQLFQEEGQTTLGAGETTNMLHTQASHMKMHDFDTTIAPATPADGLSSGAPGNHIITIKGGAINLHSQIAKVRRQPRNANYLCIHHGMHSPKPVHGYRESQLSLFCKRTMESFYLDMRAPSGDSYGAVGNLACCSSRITRTGGGRGHSAASWIAKAVEEA